jgi:multicomponent K+:H+ antiporter subunit D
MAFLAKAGIWPLNFWLVPAYASASAPVAALFAIMTKVGLYAVLRLWTAVLRQAGASAHFGGDWLVYGGMATWRGRSVDPGRAAPGAHGGLSILVSAGTLLGAIGFAQPALTGGAVLPGQLDLALCALFLLAELIERSRSANEAPLDEEEDALRRRWNRCTRPRASTSTTSRR